MQPEKNMYFNTLIENVSFVPRYFIDDILNLKNSINLVEEERHILGQGNKILRFANADAPIKYIISEISAFVASQQLPFLKNMVSYESGIAGISGSANIIMPTRYIARAGEQLMIPLMGSVTVSSKEFEETFTLSPGSIYRLNNRVDSTVTASQDFLTLFISLVDFDMKKYLLAHDWHSPYTRKKDEYANPSLAAEVIEVQPAY
jgi:hypothetical protein